MNDETSGPQVLLPEFNLYGEGSWLHLDGYSERSELLPEQQLFLEVLKDTLLLFGSPDSAHRQEAIADFQAYLKPGAQGGLLLACELLNIDWDAFRDYCVRRWPDLLVPVEVRKKICLMCGGKLDHGCARQSKYCENCRPDAYRRIQRECQRRKTRGNA